MFRLDVNFLLHNQQTIAFKHMFESLLILGAMGINSKEMDGFIKELDYFFQKRNNVGLDMWEAFRTFVTCINKVDYKLALIDSIRRFSNLEEVEKTKLRNELLNAMNFRINSIPIAWNEAIGKAKENGIL